jgi:hypothetical protein
MKEYIDREATLNERPEGRNPGQVGKEEYNKGWNDCRSAFYKCITSMPAADVAPVRHGRWEPPAVGKYGVLCSVCRSQVDNPFVYCPNCGAKMNLEDTKND